jgi:hypothetical protein
MFKKIEKKVIALLGIYGNKIAKNKSDIYFHPNIPTKKLNNAINSYTQSLRHRDILALCDDTLFGGAEDGFIIARKGIFYKNLFEKPRCFLYTQLDSVYINLDNKLILDYTHDPYEKINAYLDTMSSNSTDSSSDWEIVKAYAEHTQNILSDLSDIRKEKIIFGIDPKYMELFLQDIIKYISKLQTESEDSSKLQIENDDRNDNETIDQMDYFFRT